ncbi:MAG: hypothetical protein AAF682_14815 [Planctomycetota bacterium]
MRVAAMLACSLLASALRAQDGPVFVENLGQWQTDARFVAADGDRQVRVAEDALYLQIERACGDAREGALVALRFEGASSAARVVGRGESPSSHSVFRGADPAAWRSGLRGYRAVTIERLYDGVDLVVRRDADWVAYDLLLAPGADLAQVRVHADGARRVDVAPDGSLRLTTDLGTLAQSAPIAWQVRADGTRAPLHIAVHRLGDTAFGFSAPERDAALATVVDPGLVWSTYLGGEDGDDVYSVAVDGAGVITASGTTRSLLFPSTPGAFSQAGLSRDVFVVRIDPASSTLVYSARIGGVESDYAEDLAVDADGAAYVAGYTFSRDFPTTASFDPDFSGSSDAQEAFLLKLDPTGSSLVYSTFLGGTPRMLAYGLAVDDSGAATVAGTTNGADLPTTPGAFQELPSSSPDDFDAFVLRMAPDGGALIWATYLGGDGDEYLRDLALDASGGVVVAGHLDSLNFPVTPGAAQTSYSGDTDMFATRFEPDGSALRYSTYLGGTEPDLATDVGLAQDGTAFVVGESLDGFPTTPGAFQEQAVGWPNFGDGVVVRLGPTGEVERATYLGGSIFPTDTVRAVAVDASGLPVVVGNTGSVDFPKTPGSFGTGIQNWDVYVARFAPELDRLFYAGIFSTPALDSVAAVALAQDGTVVVGGSTESLIFPTTPDGLQLSNQGGADAYLSVLDPLPTGVARVGASTPACAGPILAGPTKMPVTGDASFGLWCSGAPPQAAGALLVGLTPDPAGTAVLGANLHVGAVAAIELAATDEHGYAEVGLPVPAAAPGLTVYAQFGWLNPPGCGAAGGLSASDALELVVQP